MNKYTNGERTIYATEKAYKLIYKAQGFRLWDGKLEEIGEGAQAEGESADTEITNKLETLKADELREIAKERNVEGYSKMKKEELIETLKG